MSVFVLLSNRDKMYVSLLFTAQRLTIICFVPLGVECFTCQRVTSVLRCAHIDDDDAVLSP